METIGERLRRAREENNLSLESVSEVTKIGIIYLKALENDEYEKVVAPTYAKGFLKIYSAFLELDTAEIIDDFMKDHIAESKQTLVLEGEEVKKPSFIPYLRGLEWKLLAASIILVLFLFLIFKGFFGESEEKVQIEKSAMIEEAIGEKSELILPAQIAEAKSSTVVPVKGEMTLSVRATEKVWLRIHADKKLVFEHTLRKGDSETWHAREVFGIKIGNAGGMEVMFNGKPLGNLGPRGKIVNLTLTREGVKIED